MIATLSGKVVLVTGASSGIGEATARLCAAQGARVLLVARRADRLLQLQQELGEEKALAFPCDVRDRDSVHSAFLAALTDLGGLDAVVNNAGKGMYQPVADMNTEDWDDLWGVNVQGALHVMQEAAHLLPSGGVIVNVASIAGKVVAPYMGGYSATKFALVALSDALRLELAGRGIRVVTLFPGSTETEFRANAVGSETVVKKRITRVKADRVAHVILNTLLNEKTRVWVTWPDRMAATFGQIFPGITDRVLKRTLLTRQRK